MSMGRLSLISIAFLFASWSLASFADVKKDTILHKFKTEAGVEFRCIVHPSDVNNAKDLKEGEKLELICATCQQSSSNKGPDYDLPEGPDALEFVF